MLAAAAAQAAPSANGTWLSQPQIWFYTSRGQLERVMAQIRAERYRVVFLDYRQVSDAMQQEVAQAARRHGLMPVVWVQSPQYRRMGGADLIHAARHGDGIQVDDHFFANYNQGTFSWLRQTYTKPIFCSIQPFQAALVPSSGCNQLDVQCYTPQTFHSCVKLADRLGAVVSLSTQNTIRFRSGLAGRFYNTFLWPDPAL
jgi:hypothetical protein